MIPPDTAHPAVGPFMDSVVDHGAASMEQIQAWEETFLGRANIADHMTLS